MTIWGRSKILWTFQRLSDLVMNHLIDINPVLTLSGATYLHPSCFNSHDQRRKANSNICLVILECSIIIITI